MSALRLVGGVLALFVMGVGLAEFLQFEYSPMAVVGGMLVDPSNHGCNSTCPPPAAPALECLCPESSSLRNFTSEDAWPTVNVSSIAQLNKLNDLARSISYAVNTSDIPTKLVFLVELNMGFIEMAHNFIHFARRVARPPVNNIVFISLSQDVHDNLTAAGVVSVLRAMPVKAKAHDFRSKDYNFITRKRWLILEEVLNLGYEPIVTDVDILFLRNPLYYFIDAPPCDFYATTDALYPNILNSSMGSPGRYALDEKSKGIFLNMGFAVWRNTPTSREILKSFRVHPVHQHFRLQYFDDQFIFYSFLLDRAFNNQTLPTGWKPKTDVAVLDSLSQCVDWANLKVYVLPPVLFAHQKNFFEMGVGNTVNIIPYFIHFNWVIGYQNKLDLMKKHGLWFK